MIKLLALALLVALLCQGDCIQPLHQYVTVDGNPQEWQGDPVQLILYKNGDSTQPGLIEARFRYNWESSFLLLTAESGAQMVADTVQIQLDGEEQPVSCRPTEGKTTAIECRYPGVVPGEHSLYVQVVAEQGSGRLCRYVASNCSCYMQPESPTGILPPFCPWCIGKWR